MHYSCSHLATVGVKGLKHKHFNKHEPNRTMVIRNIERLYSFSKTCHQPSSTLLTWMACFSSSMCRLSAVMYSIGVSGSVNFTGNLSTLRLDTHTHSGLHETHRT